MAKTTKKSEELEEVKTQVENEEATKKQAGGFWYNNGSLKSDWEITMKSILGAILAVSSMAPETWFHVIGGNASKEGMAALGVVE